MPLSLGGEAEGEWRNVAGQNGLGSPRGSGIDGHGRSERVPVTGGK